MLAARRLAIGLARSSTSRLGGSATVTVGRQVPVLTLAAARMATVASTRPDPSLDVETMDTTVDTDYAYAKAPKKTEPLNLEHAWESDNEYTTTEEDIDPETYVMDNEYKPSEDPLTTNLLFSVDAISIVSQETLNYRPNELPADRKVKLETRLYLLKLTDREKLFLKAIAGPRYTARTDTVKLVSERYETFQENKRAVLQLLNDCIAEAKALAKQFPTEPFTLPAHGKK